MQVARCAHIYNPLETSRFVINFELDYTEQNQRADDVIAHLETLSTDDLIEESIKYFKWIVLHHICHSNLRYAERLLAYFHSHGLLKHKQQVNSPLKQCTERYLVIFTMRGHVFARTYNSIRELRADTGKKPSQILRTPSKEIFCKLLKYNPPSYNK